MVSLSARYLQRRLPVPVADRCTELAGQEFPDHYRRRIRRTAGHMQCRVAYLVAKITQVAAIPGPVVITQQHLDKRRRGVEAYHEVREHAEARSALAASCADRARAVTEEETADCEGLNVDTGGFRVVLVRNVEELGWGVVLIL